MRATLASSATRRVVSFISSCRSAGSPPQRCKWLPLHGAAVVVYKHLLDAQQVVALPMHLGLVKVLKSLISPPAIRAAACPIPVTAQSRRIDALLAGSRPSVRGRSSPR